MTLDQLKKGFWGYQKSSVYAYITALEGEFSQKLMERDAQVRDSEALYQERIHHLEEELTTLRQQHESQQAEQLMISSALIEARKYAETLKQEADTAAREERQAWEAELEQMHKDLSQYRCQVRTLREQFASLLQSMDDQVQAFDDQVQATVSDCPGRNLKLFHRKPEEE